LRYQAKLALVMKEANQFSGEFAVEKLGLGLLPIIGLVLIGALISARCGPAD
jgi:hypothetical protein